MGKEVRDLPPLSCDRYTNLPFIVGLSYHLCLLIDFTRLSGDRYDGFPVSAFVPKKLLYPTGKPHTLLVILIKEEPSEELFRAEVMILTAAIITRLKGEECLEYNTIPMSIELRYTYPS